MVYINERFTYPKIDTHSRRCFDLSINKNINITYQTLDEDDAYQKEEELQLHYGLENLTNIFLGGKPPRTKITDKRREEMRLALVGNKINLGRVQSEEEKTRRANSLKQARVVTDEARKATSDAHLGKTVSLSTRHKISKSRKGKPLAMVSRDISPNSSHRACARSGPQSSDKRAKEQLTGKTYDQIYGTDAASEIKRKQSEWSKNNKGKPILINGVLYRSVIAASEATGLSPYLLRKIRDAN